MSCTYDDRPLYLRMVRAAVAARALKFDEDTFLKFAAAAFHEAEGDAVSPAAQAGDAGQRHGGDDA